MALVKGNSILEQIPGLSRIPRVGRGLLGQVQQRRAGVRATESGHRRPEERRAERSRSPLQQGHICLGLGRVESGQRVGRWGLGLTLQAVPIGAGAGGRRGGLGSDDGCESALLFHGGDHVGW